MRLAWSRTFPDSHHDFVARDGEEAVGRIYRESAGHTQSGRWRWFANGISAPPRITGFERSGTVDTRQEAIDALSSAWSRWLAAGRPRFSGDKGAVI